MIAFEVHINGQKICTAGVFPMGWTSAILSYSLSGEGERLSFGVSGMVSEQGDIQEIDVYSLVEKLKSRQYLKWVDEDLKPGDTIEIRIVEVVESDEPKERMLAADMLGDALKRGRDGEHPKTQSEVQKKRHPHRLRNLRSRRQ